MPTPRKHSITIKGHRTSITLEDAFWIALHDVAEEQGKSPSTLIGEIDRTRGSASLSAAIRVYLLTWFRDNAAAGREREGVKSH